MDEKILENTYNNYQNEEKKFTLKSQNENKLFFSTIDRKNDNSFSQNKNLESLGKKQIIYKKEFKGLRSLSKSTIIPNGKEIKGEN